MKLCIYQQLEEVSQQKFRSQKVAKLQLYDSVTLISVLDYTFNPDIKWLLPAGPFGYKEASDNPGYLRKRFYQEVQKLPVFLSIGPYPNLDPKKRMNLFLDVLATIDRLDAKLLMCMKDKKLPFMNITRDIIREAFPIFNEKWKAAIPRPKVKILDTPPMFANKVAK